MARYFETQEIIPVLFCLQEMMAEVGIAEGRSIVNNESRLSSLSPAPDRTSRPPHRSPFLHETPGAVGS
jgi:hypothetical protein